MSKDEIGISDEAVAEATGRTWRQWESLLDDAGGEELSHKELVALLANEGLVESAWWRQSVTVAYEKLKGRRTLGETASGGFEVGVQRTVPFNAETSWSLLKSSAGAEAWLGSRGDVSFAEGATFELADGTTGEIRVSKPDSHIRLTWKPKKWKRPSTIQVRVTPKEERSVISFHQENMPDAAAREEQRAHFKTAVEKLKKLAT